MNLRELYRQVSLDAKQKRDKLDIIDSQVVLSTFFAQLAEMPVGDAMELVAKGIKSAACKTLKDS